MTAPCRVPGPEFNRVPDIQGPYLGQYLAVWEAAPQYDKPGEKIMGRILQPEDFTTADPVYPPIEISAAAGTRGGPAVAVTNSSFIVVWQDNRNAPAGKRQRDIYFARVGYQGDLLDPQGRPLSLDPEDESDVEISMNSTGGLVVWEGSGGIRGLRLNGSGFPLDEESFLIAEHPTGAVATEPCVTTDGSAFLVAWEIGPPSGKVAEKVSGRRVSGFGAQPVLDPIIEIGATKAHEAECSLIYAENWYAPGTGSYLAAWDWTGGDDAPTNVALRRVPGDGSQPVELPIMAAQGVTSKNHVLTGNADKVNILTIRWTNDSRGFAVLQTSTVSYQDIASVTPPEEYVLNNALPVHISVSAGGGLYLVSEDDLVWRTGAATWAPSGIIFAHKLLPKLNDFGSPVPPLRAVPLSVGNVPRLTRTPMAGNGAQLAWEQELPGGEMVALMGGTPFGSSLFVDTAASQDGKRLPQRRLAVSRGTFASAGSRGLQVLAAGPSTRYDNYSELPSGYPLGAVPSAWPVGVAAAENQNSSAVFYTERGSFDSPFTKAKIAGLQLRNEGWEGSRLATMEAGIGDLPMSPDELCPELCGNKDLLCAVLYPRDAAPGKAETVWCQVLKYANWELTSLGEWRAAITMESSRPPALFSYGAGFRLFTPADEGVAGAAWRMTEISPEGVTGPPLEADFSRDAVIQQTGEGYLVLEPSVPRYVTYDFQLRRLASWKVNGALPIQGAAAAAWVNGVATYTALEGNAESGFKPALFGWDEPEIGPVRVSSRWREVDWHFPTGIPVSIETSADLKTWQTGGSMDSTFSLWNRHDGGRLIWTEQTPTLSRQFYRLASPHLIREFP